MSSRLLRHNADGNKSGNPRARAPALGRSMQRSGFSETYTRKYMRGRADDAQGLPCAIRSDRGSGQDAIPDTSAHAAAWLRLRPSQRRPRHTRAAGLPRAQEHSTHRALHRVGTASVQGLLALTLPAMRACMTRGGGGSKRRDPQEALDRSYEFSGYRGSPNHPGASNARAWWKETRRFPDRQVGTKGTEKATLKNLGSHLVQHHEKPDQKAINRRVVSR